MAGVVGSTPWPAHECPVVAALEDMAYGCDRAKYYIRKAIQEKKRRVERLETAENLLAVARTNAWAALDHPQTATPAEAALRASTPSE